MLLLTKQPAKLIFEEQGEQSEKNQKKITLVAPTLPTFINPNFNKYRLEKEKKREKKNKI